MTQTCLPVKDHSGSKQQDYFHSQCCLHYDTLMTSVFVFYFPGMCRIIAVCVHFILTSRGILAGNGFMNLKDTMLISVQEPAHIYGAQILSTAE